MASLVYYLDDKAKHVHQWYYEELSNTTLVIHYNLQPYPYLHQFDLGVSNSPSLQ